MDRTEGQLRSYQICRPKVQPLMMWSGFSSASWQISQIASWTMCFVNRTVRHWILLWSNSHMNKWTCGGAELCQMKSALGSSSWPLALSSLYRAPLSSPQSPLLKGVIRLSGAGPSVMPLRACWSRANSSHTWDDNLGTKDCCSPSDNISWIVASFLLQWENGAR